MCGQAGLAWTLEVTQQGSLNDLQLSPANHPVKAESKYPGAALIWAG